jgi:hypothetical protein
MSGLGYKKPQDGKEEKDGKNKKRNEYKDIVKKEADQLMEFRRSLDLFKNNMGPEEEEESPFLNQKSASTYSAPQPAPAPLSADTGATNTVDANPPKRRSRFSDAPRPAPSENTEQVSASIDTPPQPPATPMQAARDYVRILSEVESSNENAI